MRVRGASNASRTTPAPAKDPTHATETASESTQKSDAQQARKRPATLAKIYSDLTYGIAKFPQSNDFASKKSIAQTHGHAPFRLPNNAVDHVRGDVYAVFSEHEIDEAREQNGIEAVQLNLEPQVC